MTINTSPKNYAMTKKLTLQLYCAIEKLDKLSLEEQAAHHNNTYEAI
jgi:hypothetical protein